MSLTAKLEAGTGSQIVETAAPQLVKDPAVGRHSATWRGVHLARRSLSAKTAALRGQSGTRLGFRGALPCGGQRGAAGMDYYWNRIHRVLL